MDITELILLIAGALVFTISFLLPSGKKGAQTVSAELPEEELKALIQDETEKARQKLQDIAEETVKYSMEKTERSMEKTCNEKIMAISDYSDTVLQQIDKNHKEAVFLYDMLNDKHDKLKASVSEAGKAQESLKKSAGNADQVSERLKEAARAVQFAPIDAKQIQEAQMTDGKVLQTLPEPAEVIGTSENADTVEVTDGAETKKTVETSATTQKAGASQMAKAAGVTGKGDSSGKTKSTGTSKTAKTTRTSKVESGVVAGKGSAGNNNERIRELHKAGKSNMAIAKELSLGIGEVKLVLDLYEET